MKNKNYPISFYADNREETITDVLSMQPMPAGCFTTGHTPADDKHAESLTAINTVVFVATFKIAGSEYPVQCYGIQEPNDKTIIWRWSEGVEIYAYGPYKETCALIGEKPMGFLEWYQTQQLGYSEFDLPLADKQSTKINAS